MKTKYFSFEVEHVDKQTGARLGLLRTPHGDIQTPVYMPVGTQATVKAMTPRDVEETGASIILSNTYHYICGPATHWCRRQGGFIASCIGTSPSLRTAAAFRSFHWPVRGTSRRTVFFSALI